MKKNILILAGSLALCLGTAEAQQRDSTRTNQGSRTQQQGTEQARQPRYNEQRANATYSSGDIEIIKNNDIPESLRQSLRSDDRYQGWENAVIYHNKKTGEYLVSPRAHRFDSEGKAIDQDDKSMNRRSQQRTEKQGSQSDQSRRKNQSTSDQSATSESTTPTQSKMPQDTASSQAMSTTDQGRMQSTESRMTQDTTNQKSTSGEYSNSGESATQSQQSDAYRTERKSQNPATETDVPMEGMVEVQTSEVPTSLRETLADDEYKGWESGKLYRHASTGEYMLVVDGKNATDGKQTYRFDKDGKIKGNK